MATAESELRQRPKTGSKKLVWAGYILSSLSALFLLIDGVMKLFKPEIVVKTTIELGYSAGVIVPLGIVLLIATVLYIIPRTSILGAILLTGYLGGAVATHVRVGDDPFSIVFPVIIGSVIWLGLHMRDAGLRTILPLRNAPNK